MSLAEVFNTLQVYLGSYYVNNFNEFGRSWQVNVMADTPFRDRIDDIKLLKVRNKRARWCRWAPCSTCAIRAGRPLMMRYNMYSATAINGNVAPGTSSGQAIERHARDRRPKSCRARWPTTGPN